MAKVHYSSNAHEKRLRKWLEDYSKSTGTPLHERAKIQPNKNKEDVRFIINVIIVYIILNLSG